MLIIAPNKNDIIDIAKILEEPKKRPNAALILHPPFPLRLFQKLSCHSNVNIPKLQFPLAFLITYPSPN